MNKTVKDVLTSLINKPVKYFPNTGNAGDSIINVGFYQFADELGLSYQILTFDDVKDITCDDIVILGGGGTLVKEQLTTIDYLKIFTKKTKQFIVLPHSINHCDDFMKSLRSQDIVFCREKYSIDYCETLDLKCEVHIDNDMAFYVNFDQLKNAQTQYKPKTSLYNIIRYIICFFHIKLRSKFCRHISAYRCDREINPEVKVNRKIYNDLSAVARFCSGGKAESFYAAKYFVQLIDSYKSLESDRLHVVLVAALLNKEVIARNNSYYKVRGIIEYSLSTRSNVKLLK